MHEFILKYDGIGELIIATLMAIGYDHINYHDFVLHFYISIAN